MNHWSYIGIILVALITWKFITEIGKGLPVLEFLLLISGLQWIVGPINSYRSSVQHYKYYMYVSEAEYMSYVVPAFLLFTVIILLKKKPFFNLSDLDFGKYSRYGKPILLIGIVADVVGSYVPPSLAFFFFLLAQLKFIGASILIFSPSAKDRYIFFGVIGYLFLKSLGSAMFHDLILWGAFLFMLWALKNQPGIRTKIFIFLGAAFLITGIQLIKSSYREQVWGGYEGNKISLFLNILTEEVKTTDFEDDSEQEDLNMRLNQGWIISAIMKETFQNQAFANGETVQEAVTASLIPRFLAPDKKIAGGQDNFIKYTGLELGKNTSMGMSIMGEAYANFGGIGGITFMLIWGFFITVFWNKIVIICQNHPLLIFFIPLLFLQVVKAETELAVVMNHLVKASILVALFFWSTRKFLKWKI